MVASILDWAKTSLATITARYGVDPRIYLAVVLANTPFFWFFLVKLLRAIARHDRSRIMPLFGLCLLLNQSPTLYLLFFGHSLPWWVWLMGGLLAAWGVVTLTARAMRARRERPKRQPSPTVSVIIPTLNEER
jgi:hypothetical protein